MRRLEQGADLFGVEHGVRIDGVVVVGGVLIVACRYLACGHEGAFDLIDGIAGDFAAPDGGAENGADDSDDGVDRAGRVFGGAHIVSEFFDHANADLIEAQSPKARQDVFVEPGADVGDMRGPAVGLAVEPKFGCLLEGGQLLEFEVFAPINLYDGFRKKLFSCRLCPEINPLSSTACAQRAVVQAEMTAAISASTVFLVDALDGGHIVNVSLSRSSYELADVGDVGGPTVGLCLLPKFRRLREGRQFS